MAISTSPVRFWQAVTMTTYWGSAVAWIYLSLVAEGASIIKGVANAQAPPCRQMVYPTPYERGQKPSLKWDMARQMRRYQGYSSPWQSDRMPNLCKQYQAWLRIEVDMRRVRVATACRQCLMYMAEYPNGTGNELKIRQLLICLRVQISSLPPLSSFLFLLYDKAGHPCK